MDEKNENTTKIQFKVNKDFKNNVKQAILEKGVNSFQDGYEQIFKMGLEVFKKNG